MCMQLLEAFVVAVDRKEERFGVGGVNRNRHLIRRSGFPHRIETCIVDLDQLSRCNAFTQVQAQRLEHLDASCAELMRSLDLVGLKLRITGFGRFAPPWLRKDDETVR